MKSPSAVLKLRAGLFYSGYAVLTVWFSLTALLLAPLPLRIRGRYLIGWNFCVLVWLRWTCGVRYRLHGAENLPEQTGYVVLANHQSQWETFFLQWRLFPIVFVLKRELLKVPFFGWGLKLMAPIAIDRGNPKQAIRDTMAQGQQRLEDGISVLIFPEGTRTRPGEVKPFARGGANLAIAAKVPVVPIAHNAADCWPADQWVKYPGTIDVVIGEPILNHNRSSREISDEAEQWIRTTLAGLSSRQAITEQA